MTSWENLVWTFAALQIDYNRRIDICRFTNFIATSVNATAKFYCEHLIGKEHHARSAVPRILRKSYRCLQRLLGLGTVQTRPRVSLPALVLVAAAAALPTKSFTRNETGLLMKMRSVNG